MYRFAEVPLTLPTPELLGVIEQRFPVSSLRDWAWRESYATPGGIPPFDAPEPLNPEINTLIWPVQPTRWAYGHFLASGSQLVDIRAALSAESGGYGDLTFDDDDQTVTVRMKLVNAYPLFQVTPTTSTTSSTTTCPAGVAEDDLYLLTFVDRRFFWWYKPADPKWTTFCSWKELFTTVGQQLGIGSITVEDVPEAYGKPSARWDYTNWQGYPYNLLLESAAKFVGARVVCRTDGTVVVQRPGKRQDDTNQFNTFSDKFLMGGVLPIQEALDSTPSNVRVVYYDNTVENYDCNTSHTEEDYLFSTFVSTRSSGLTSSTSSIPCTTTSTSTTTTSTTDPFGCVNSTVIVPDTSAVIWSDHDNSLTATERQEYTKQIAYDWYLWRIPSVSAVFAGAVDWSLSGLSDRLEFRHTLDDFDTRVIPANNGPENNIAPGSLCQRSQGECPDCEGECLWTITAGEWVLTTNGCACPCQCAPPDFCPEVDPGCSPITTRTRCNMYDGVAPGAPICTSSTTTTLPSNCVSSCYWYRDASGVFFRVYPDLITPESRIGPTGAVCDGSISYTPLLQCGGKTPLGDVCGVCDLPAILPCETGETVCAATTTMPCVPSDTPCFGVCSWVWDTDPLFGFPSWLQLCGSCETCARPSFDGASCGVVSETPCCVDTDPGCGECLWKWSGTAWVLANNGCNCGCLCQAPGFDGDSACNIERTPCNPDSTTTTTTTTTTSSTTTSSTTTAPAGCQNTCSYEFFCCDNLGNVDPAGGYGCVDIQSSCTGACGCAEISALHFVSRCGDGIPIRLLSCVYGGAATTGVSVIGPCASCV